MNCEKCGKSFGDDAEFCPECGAPATSAKQPEQAPDEDILKIQAELSELMNSAENSEDKSEESTADQVNETLTGKSEKAQEPAVTEEEKPEDPGDAPEEEPKKETVEEAPEEKPEEKPEETPKEKTEEKPEETPGQEEPEEKTGFVDSVKKSVLGLPAKTKKIIIISASAAAALALVLVLIFAVIIPAAEPKIDASNYLTVVFDSQSQFEGCLSGSITIDRAAVLSDCESEITNELAVTGAIDRLLYEANIEYRVENEEGKTNSSLNSVYFDNLESDDVLTVTLSWAEDSTAKDVIKTEERNSGLKFDRSTVTKTLKLSDYIEKQGVDIKKPVTLDILDYIKANNLVITVPSDDKLTVGVDSFKTEAYGYTLVNDSLYGDSIGIYDKDNKYFTSVYLEVDGDDDIAEGDVVELRYSDENSSAKGAGFLLAGDPVVYTVTSPEVLSAESAKTNLDSIKEYFAKNKETLDTDIKDGDVVEINSVYFSANKKDASFNKLVIVYTDKTQKYSRVLELSRDGFFSGGRFVFYGYTELNSKEKTAAEAEKSCECIDEENKDYTVTKVG